MMKRNLNLKSIQKSFNPLVSIIIPTFNRFNMLKEAVKSALTQTYSNLEVIIYDNKSDDDTKNIGKIFIDKRLKFYQAKNREKIWDGWRSALSLANGDYILFLPDDDRLVNREYIDKAINILRYRKNIVFVYGGIRQFFVEQNKKIDRLEDFGSFIVGKNWFIRYAKNNNRENIVIASTVFRRDILKKFWVMNKGINDCAVMLLGALEGNIGYIESICYEFKIYKEQISSKWKKDVSFIIPWETKYIDYIADNALEKGLANNTIKEWKEKLYTKALEIILNNSKYNLTLFELIVNIENSIKDINSLPIFIYGKGELGKFIFENFKEKYNIIDFIDDYDKSCMNFSQFIMRMKDKKCAIIIGIHNPLIVLRLRKKIEKFSNITVIDGF